MSAAHPFPIGAKVKLVRPDGHDHYNRKLRAGATGVVVGFDHLWVEVALDGPRARGLEVFPLKFFRWQLELVAPWDAVESGGCAPPVLVEPEPQWPGVLAVLDSQIRGIEQDGKTRAVQLREARAAAAELIEANAELNRACAFMDDVRAPREETLATGVHRDAVEWIESAARKCVAALACVEGKY